MNPHLIVETDGYGRMCVLSPCRVYRYWLERDLVEIGLVEDQGPGVRRVYTFIMLNPSTADGRGDDRTIARCLGYAIRAGATHLVVVNLFALRARDPDALARAAANGISPVAHDDVALDAHNTNADALRRAIREATTLVAGWGDFDPVPGYGNITAMPLTIAWEERRTINALELTKVARVPRHPLYLKASLVARPWSAPDDGHAGKMRSCWQDVGGL